MNAKQMDNFREIEMIRRNQLQVLEIKKTQGKKNHAKQQTWHSQGKNQWPCKQVSTNYPKQNKKEKKDETEQTNLKCVQELWNNTENSNLGVIKTAGYKRVGQKK